MTPPDRPLADRRLPPRAAETQGPGNLRLFRMEKREGGGSRHSWRLSEIERLIHSRLEEYECDVIEEDYLRAALPSLLVEMGMPRRPHYRSSVEAWIAWNVPGLRDSPDRWLSDLVAEYVGPPPLRALRADGIATALKVTMKERTALKFRTIGAIGMTKRQRQSAQKKIHAARERARRKAAGAVPRSESKSATKPWKSLGIGRSKYYAMAKAGLVKNGLDAPPRTNSCESEKRSRGRIRAVTLDAPRTNSCVVGIVDTLDAVRNCPPASKKPRAETPTENAISAVSKSGRRQAETNLDTAATSPVATRESERSEPLAGAAPAARPAGEAARAASASHPPPAQRPTEADELRVPLPPTSGPSVPLKLRRALEAWTIGPMPEIARQAFVDTKKRLRLKQPEAAKAIGVDVRDLAGADQPGIRLRPAAIAKAREWLLGQDHPEEVDPLAGLRSRKPSDSDGQLQLRLLRVVEKPEAASRARPTSTVYGLPSGREPGFGYVEHDGRTVGMVGFDGRVWMASYRGQSVGEHRTKRDAVAEVRRRAALDIARVG